MTNNPWIVKSYLSSMCQYVTIGLIQVINAPMVEPIDFEGWTFRFVCHDDKKTFEPIPVVVDAEEKLVIFNMEPELYNIEVFDYIEIIADYLIRGFYQGRDNNPVEFLFGEDDSLTDPIDMLCDQNKVFVDTGIGYIDIVIDEWAAQLDADERAQAMREIMQVCDNLCEFIDFGI